MSLRFFEIVLAGLNIDRRLRDAVIGDLLEERNAMAALDGERRAARWMWRQVLLSILAFADAVLRKGGIRLIAAIAGAAVTAMLAIGVLIGASSAVWVALLPPEAVVRLTAVALAADLAFGTVGGYLAARLGRAAPLAAAVAFGGLAVALTLLLTGNGWYRLVLQLLVFPATLTGGWLRARHLARVAPPL